MTNDLNDHFSVLLRSLLAEVLTTIETIGTIRFSSCACLQASVLALDFVACQSKKRANIHNRWLSSRRLRSLRSPMMMVEPSSKRANIWGMFTACLRSPSSRTSCRLSCENPQVTFASLSSPAVMDIRPLRGRSSLAEVFSTTIRFPCLCSSLAEVLKTIETIGTIFSLLGYLHFL